VKVGDLVKPSAAYPTYDEWLGTIIGIAIQMWTDKTVPSGVRIMWCDGGTEDVYEDEVEVIDERN